MTAAAGAGDGRVPLRARAGWGVPFALAVGLGTAAGAQLATGDEAAWYVTWPVVAALVAVISLVAAGRTFRPLVLCAAPIAVLAGLGQPDGTARWLLLPVVLAATVGIGRVVDRDRLS